MRTSNLKANIMIIHIVRFQFVKNSYFQFLQGSMATLFWWSWKILSYFVANLSKTLRINLYQNRSSIVEVMIKKICVFYASQCTHKSTKLSQRNDDDNDEVKSLNAFKHASEFSYLSVNVWQVFGAKAIVAI